MGADWPLVQDALIIAALALGAGGAITALLLRGRRRKGSDRDTKEAGPGPLEERVRVLERIATDQSIGLADEIEALRKTGKAS